MSPVFLGHFCHSNVSIYYKALNAQLQNVDVQKRKKIPKLLDFIQIHMQTKGLKIYHKQLQPLQSGPILEEI